jgi:hypothetical protein
MTFFNPSFTRTETKKSSFRSRFLAVFDGTRLMFILSVRDTNHRVPFVFWLAMSLSVKRLRTTCGNAKLAHAEQVTQTGCWELNVKTGYLD